MRCNKPNLVPSMAARPDRCRCDLFGHLLVSPVASDPRQEHKPTTMGANKENTIVLKGAVHSGCSELELRPST